jgi:hemoglobin
MVEMRRRRAGEKRGQTPDLLRRVQDLAAATGRTAEEFLRDAVAAQAQRDPEQPTTLYGRLGYAGGVRRLVHSLYPRVLADPLLMSHFTQLGDHGMEWLRWHMLTFLAVATGGPSSYAGRDLRDAHNHLYITGEAFDRLLDHLSATMDSLAVAHEDQQAVQTAILGLRNMIVSVE